MASTPASTATGAGGVGGAPRQHAIKSKQSSGDRIYRVIRVVAQGASTTSPSRESAR